MRISANHSFVRILLSVLLFPVFWNAGCSQTMPDRPERMKKGYIYYLDGAGGSGLIMNWSGGVRQGMLNAGYDGAGEMFPWGTHEGVMADQTASAEYKRGKAAELARKIVEYKQEHPDAPVTIMGLSAGTAVAAFTLEALPPNVKVETVILLSGSLSSTYNLTRGLQHVTGKCYIFTSENDAVLRFAVPMAGTADQTSSSGATIGLEGPQMPRPATPETRAQYAKIVKVPWNREFERYGNFGAHTDTVKGPFIEAFVAPLVLRTMTKGPTPSRFASGRTTNPDYQRWSAFAPDSYVVFQGYQIIDSQKRPMRMKARLVNKASTQLVVERENLGSDAESDGQILGSRFFVTAQIDAKSHPLSSPDTVTNPLPSKKIRIRDTDFDCTGKSVNSSGDFPAWGKNLKGTIYSNNSIPGGIARFDIATTMNGHQVRFVGDVVDFHIGST
ncbi:MAG TPA: hypothetical protein VMV81_02535 [Phycisphaerae bacterium]|nr:hypothetical protein [Phycisphaerae bacterium]